MKIPIDQATDKATEASPGAMIVLTAFFAILFIAWIIDYRRTIKRRNKLN
jgi:hypothetical protein